MKKREMHNRVPHSIRAIIQMVILGFSTTVFVVAGTYYVDPAKGNDSSGTGSAGSPWASWSYAYSQLASGDTLYLKGGNYTFATLQNTYGVFKPLFTSNVTIRAATGETPIFTNKIQIGDANHVGKGEAKYQGTYDAYLTFVGVTAADGVEIWGARHIVFDKCVIKTLDPALNGTSAQNTAKANRSAYSVNGCYDMKLLNSSISDAGVGVDLIYSSYCLVKDCNLKNFTQDGVHFGSSRYCVLDGVSISELDDGVSDGDIDPETGATFAWNKHPDCVQVLIAGSSAPYANMYCIIRNSRLWNAEGQGIQFNNYRNYAGAAWVTSKTYLVGAATYTGGNVYTCLVGHTSGTFNDDLSAGYWKFESAFVANSDFVFENNILGPTGANSINSADTTHRMIVRNNSFRRGTSTFKNPNAYVFPGSSAPRSVTSTLGSFRYSNGNASEGYTDGGAIYNNIFGTLIETPLNAYCDYNLIEYSQANKAYPRNTIVQTDTNNFAGDYSSAVLLDSSVAINSGTNTNNPEDPLWYSQLLTFFALSPSALKVDRYGTVRDSRPDAGAFESNKTIPSKELTYGASPKTSVYFDDFEDANFTADGYIGAEGMTPLEWTQLVTDTPMLITRRQDAQRNVITPTKIAGATSFIRTKDGENWKDLTLTFWASNAYSQKNEGPCLLVVDSNNYYLVDIGSASGTIYRVLNGTATAIGQSNAIRLPAAGATKFSVTVEHDASSVKFSVDYGADATIDFTCKDTDATAVAKFTTGGVGFYHAVNGTGTNYLCSYDDVLIQIKAFSDSTVIIAAPPTNPNIDVSIK